MLVFTYTDQSGQDQRFLGRRGDFAFSKGDVGNALRAFQAAQRSAEQAGNGVLKRQYLNNVGACQLALFRYDDAAQTLLEVRKSAKRARDYPILASASGNLSALFTQTDDLPAAEMYARESLDAYSRTKAPSYKPLLSLAYILSRRPLSSLQTLDPEPEKYFRQGIDAAARAGDWFAVTEGWLHYGERLREAGRLAEADHALTEALQLRRRGKLSAQEACLWDLSQLRLLQARYPEALSLIDSAIGMASKTGTRVPLYRLLETRAEAELDLGNAARALSQAREAIQSARIARAGVIRDDNELIGAEVFFENAYSTLINAGNRLYQRTGDAALLRETFEAVEENRAETLEALLPDSTNWRKKLPFSEYREKTFAIERQQGRLLVAPTPENKRRFTELQAELTEMEMAAGSPHATPAGAVFDSVQRNLPADSAVLSFHLGDPYSWLWAVDSRGLHLRQLPAKKVIEEQIRTFQEAIGRNDAGAIETHGQALYRDLFGGPEQSYATARRWFLSVEEQLYTLSFPALVAEVRDGKPVYLTQQRSLQIIPGAKLLRSPEKRNFRSGDLLFAGDGIYNRADPRYEDRKLMRPAAWSMPRLAGSGDEVRFAAGLWPNAILLTGSHMTRANLLNQIDRDPAIIHIASHAVEGQDRWHSAILALGIDRSGEPDLLTQEEIVLHPIHSRLVVMTGCSSGTGQPVPVSGLMGLTHSWLAAGAGAVLATRWPTRDETANGLIGRFYTNLLTSRNGNIPDSLRLAREELLARGGWRAEPRYWAGFFLIGNR
jgi:CHAT domain-containing protein